LGKVYDDQLESFVAMYAPAAQLLQSQR